MIINDLDLGSFSPFKIPVKNFHTALVAVPGGYAIPYALEGDPDDWKLRIWIKAPAAVGQYAAGTQAAAEFLTRQLEEMVRNPDLQPLYIQLYAGTGVVAHSPAFSEPQDGWYYITQLTADYTRSQFGFTVVEFTIHSVSPGPPRRIGIWTSGGALGSNYSGQATNWAAYPIGVTATQATINRTGGEGAIPITNGGSLVLNPAPFIPSATIANWFKGGCRVYDAMAAIGSNAVPTNGTFTNANWIEVKGADHRYVGDIVITNGLHLYTLSSAVTPGVVGYLWNTGLAVAAWQQFGSLQYADNGTFAGQLQQISLMRVGPEEVAWQLEIGTGAGLPALVSMRLQRGAYSARLDFRPQGQANTNGLGMQLIFNTPSNVKVSFNPARAGDFQFDPNTIPIATDYGYAGGWSASSSYPFIAGLLWQNEPNSNQGLWAGTAQLGIGDTTGPAQNATRSYGVFAIPFGTSTTTVDKLQAEAESGAFTGAAGWSSQANASASAGNEAKLASGSLTGAINTFGTSYVPPAGSYRCWFRIKVTSAASALSQFKYGLYNVTDAVYMQSTTIAATAVTTSYVWYSSGAVFTPTSAKNMQFRCESTATVATDWFVDEAVLVPATSTTTLGFPQDIWQQFIYERSVKQVLG